MTVRYDSAGWKDIRFYCTRTVLNVLWKATRGNPKSSWSESHSVFAYSKMPVLWILSRKSRVECFSQDMPYSILFNTENSKHIHASLSVPRFLMSENDSILPSRQKHYQNMHCGPPVWFVLDKYLGVPRSFYLNALLGHFWKRKNCLPTVQESR